MIHLTRFEITVFGRGKDIDVPVPVGLRVCGGVVVAVFYSVVCLCWLAGNAEATPRENLQDLVSLVPVVLSYLFRWMNIDVLCSRRIKSGDTPTTTLQISVALVLLARLDEKKKERKKKRSAHPIWGVFSFVLREWTWKRTPPTRMKFFLSRNHTHLQLSYLFPIRLPPHPISDSCCPSLFNFLKRNSHKLHFLLLFGSFFLVFPFSGIIFIYLYDL